MNTIVQDVADFMLKELQKHIECWKYGKDSDDKNEFPGRYIISFKTDDVMMAEIIISDVVASNLSASVFKELKELQIGDIIIWDPDTAKVIKASSQNQLDKAIKIIKEYIHGLESA